MAKEDQHEQDAGAPDGAAQLPPGISPHGAARRRFARAGLGASGVILTLASQPGMATEKLMCTSASAFGYFTPASHQQARVACDGRSPDYWKTWTGQWHGAYTSPNAKFGEVFKCFGNTAPLAGMTLLQVLGPPGEYEGRDKHIVGMHIVAALLNARCGRVPQLPETKVFEIWNEYSRTQHYCPREKTLWNGAQIVDYLKSTMG